MTSSSTPSHIPLIEMTRGGMVENTQYGSYAVVDSAGASLRSAGAPGAPVYARSSLKPMQALAMLRAGLDLPDELLALSAASHSGAKMHLDGVARILSLHGLDTAALRNVSDGPLGVAEREAWLRADLQPSTQMQTCSGKHSAMLATCVVNGWSIEDYLDPAHPLQLHIKSVIEELTEEASTSDTVDGCGTPLPAFSLTGLALAHAKIGKGAAGGVESGTHEARLFNAISSYPEMLSGEHRDVARLMRAVPGLISKDGAEAVLTGALNDGTGFAVKISDGGPRVLLTVGIAMLQALGAQTEALNALTTVPVFGGGKVVGEMRPVAGAFAS